MATLKFAERTPSGWTPARARSFPASDWFVNWADVPSVHAPGERHDGRPTGCRRAAAGTYAYDVRLSRSTDDGKTWTPSVDASLGRHADRTWIRLARADARRWWPRARLARRPRDEGRRRTRRAWRRRHDAALRRLRSSMEADRRKRPSTTGSATAARPTPRSPPTVRSSSTAIAATTRFATSRSARLIEGKWSDACARAPDNWKIQACPVNGPAIDARGRDVVVAWFSAVGDQPKAFAAFSKDAGRSFGPPITAGRRRHARPRRRRAAAGRVGDRRLHRAGRAALAVPLPAHRRRRPGEAADHRGWPRVGARQRLPADRRQRQTS